MSVPYLCSGSYGHTELLTLFCTQCLPCEVVLGLSVRDLRLGMMLGNSAQVGFGDLQLGLGLGLGRLR